MSLSFMVVHLLQNKVEKKKCFLKKYVFYLKKKYFYMEKSFILKFFFTEKDFFYREKYNENVKIYLI